MANRPRNLTNRQRQFVAEYLKDLNATRAAIRAGYSRRRASEIGSKLVRKSTVAAAIRAAQDERARRTEVGADRVVREYARIAFANMTTFAKWGSGDVELINSATLSEDDAAAVAEVTQSAHGIKIKLHDKIRALDKLGDHLGLWKRDPTELLEIFLAGLPRGAAASIRAALSGQCDATIQERNAS